MERRLLFHLGMNTHSPRIPDFAEEVDIDAMIEEALALGPREERVGNVRRITFEVVDAQVVPAAF